MGIKDAYKRIDDLASEYDTPKNHGRTDEDYFAFNILCKVLNIIEEECPEVLEKEEK